MQSHTLAYTTLTLSTDGHCQWTGDISNIFDEMNHDAILELVWWALNSVAKWTSNTMRRTDRFSVDMYGKGAHTGCDYTEGEMVMITAKQVMQVCRYDLSHSYVNVRHKLYTQGLGNPMGGMLSAFYAILCCSCREATTFTTGLRELALPFTANHKLDLEWRLGMP